MELDFFVKKLIHVDKSQETSWCFLHGDEHEDSDEAALTSILLREVSAKMQYLDHEWGFVDASKSEQPKKHFLDPLSWDMPPHKAVVSVVEAVLLLFDVPLPSKLSDEDTWRACWGLWIVKNIEAHSSGWEWLAHNEPIGLFTKPYALSVSNLDRVYWAGACAAYLHMVEHCLPEFDGYEAVQTLVTPPKRTPKENAWFRCESEDGVAYFYNRLYQSITLDRPQDFDGAHIAQKNIRVSFKNLSLIPYKLTYPQGLNSNAPTTTTASDTTGSLLIHQNTASSSPIAKVLRMLQFSVSKLRTVVAA
ncbi:hypothetical protein GQ600_5167 [Phytophthora cactorum]|nr:hypothetical protein GQ600_5167 [Phytophthora cactorum]